MVRLYATQIELYERNTRATFYLESQAAKRARKQEREAFAIVGLSILFLAAYVTFSVANSALLI